MEVYQVATKGQQESNPSWVTRYVLSISEDGSSFVNYTQGGQTRVRRLGQNIISVSIYLHFKIQAVLLYNCPLGGHKPAFDPLRLKLQIIVINRTRVFFDVTSKIVTQRFRINFKTDTN